MMFQSIMFFTFIFTLGVNADAAATNQELKFMIDTADFASKTREYVNENKDAIRKLTIITLTMGLRSCERHRRENDTEQRKYCNWLRENLIKVAKVDPEASKLLNEGEMPRF